jgi:hypothetical protein
MRAKLLVCREARRPRRRACGSNGPSVGSRFRCSGWGQLSVPSGVKDEQGGAMQPRTCEQCGQAYQGNSRQRYCSPSCSQLALNDESYQRRFHALLKALDRLSDDDVGRMPKTLRDMPIGKASALVRQVWSRPVTEPAE